MSQGFTQNTSSASQAQMEAATATNVPVTPGVAKYHPGVAKAWVTFNGTGTPSIGASHNVSSITDNGVGDYTINFTTAFSSTNYCLAGVANRADSATSTCIVFPVTLSTGSCQIRTVTSADGTHDPSIVSVCFFGDQ